MLLLVIGATRARESSTDGIKKRSGRLPRRRSRTRQRVGCGLNEDQVLGSNERVSLNSDGRIVGRRTDRLYSREGTQQRCWACRRRDHCGAEQDKTRAVT
jgi:hypothetical protein